MLHDVAPVKQKIADGMRARLIVRLIGETDDLAHVAMAEAVIDRAMSITHKCGTPEASEAAYWETIRGFVDTAWVVMREE